MQAGMEMNRNDDRPDSEDSNLLIRKQSLYEILVATVFTGALIWLMQFLMNPGTLPIKQVRIEGDFTNLSTQVLQDLIRNDVKGGFFNINVTAIRNSLLWEPWVNDVSVHRVWPDSLQIYVTEQIAVARWNENGLLNSEGVLFNPDIASIPDNLPLLSGPLQTQKLMLEKYYFLSDRLANINMRLDQLVLDDRRSWQFITSDGLRVVLGKNSFNEKIERFINQIPQGLENTISNVEKIDMRYPNGFSVQWKPSTDGQQQIGVL